ncbi:YjfB family protein [Clostridium sp. E02]|uniref:YjfB family protein n=1 Tax=Clostridium sp. E02 TaxID=2487134 RepID=UPI000F51D2F9|nr:YjfB family protein [Clostridium sp. E02]
MDIAALSMGLSSARLQQSVSIGVTKKAMDSQEVAAAGLMNMISTARPAQVPADGLGQIVDLRA